jgi:hypothetical protein
MPGWPQVGQGSDVDIVYLVVAFADSCDYLPATLDGGAAVPQIAPGVRLELTTL